MSTRRGRVRVYDTNIRNMHTDTYVRCSRHTEEMTSGAAEQTTSQSAIAEDIDGLVRNLENLVARWG